MYGNWVRQQTTTSGTGTITLGSASTGYITVGDVYSDGDLVPYTIQDGNNRERGLGTYTASGTTLARTLVLETLVSGVHDRIAPTAITLSGGTAIVTVSPSNASSYPVAPAPQDPTTLSSAHMPTHPGGVTAAITANRQVALPFQLLYPLRCNEIRTYLAAGDAGSTSRVGLSRMDQNGRPMDGYIVEGAIDSTTSGAKSFSFTAVDLLPGWYFIHLVCDSATPTWLIWDGRYGNWTPIDTINRAERPVGANYYYSDIGAWSVLAAASSITSVTFIGNTYWLYLGGTLV